MHHPPEVRFVVTGSPWPRRFFACVGALGVLQGIWFSLVTGPFTWSSVAVGVSLLVAAVACLYGTQSIHGDLQWDGSQWQWSGFKGGACLLQRHLDFQALVLISLHRLNEPPVWLWLQQSQDSRQWFALRRAMIHTTAPERVHSDQGPAQARYVATP